MGNGYVLYFEFLKYCIYLLFSIFCISGVYNLITNVQEGDCYKEETSADFCEASFSTELSIANKRNNDDLLMIQVWLNFSCIIVLILFFHLMRFCMRKTAISAEDRTVSPADYTVQLSNLPHHVTDEEIKEWIENLSTDVQQIQCRKINRAYHIVDFEIYETKKNELHKRLYKEMDHTNKLILEQELEQLEREENIRVQSQEQKYTDVAYVTLANAKMADYLCRSFKMNSVGKAVYRINPWIDQKNKLKGEKIKIVRAPEPSDILWGNLGYSTFEKFKYRAITIFVSTLVLVIGFVLIFLVYDAQKIAKKNVKENSAKITLFSIAGSILICIINSLLTWTIRRLAGSEKRGTQTSYSTAIAKKQAIASLFNTSFTTILVEIIMSEGFSLTSNFLTGLDTVNIYGKGGIIENMFTTFIISALYSPIFNLIDLSYIWKKCQQDKVLEGDDIPDMTQAEANALFEGPKPNMSLKYSVLLKTMLLTSFYAPAMPICLPITILGLIFLYWTDKYLLLRRNCLPPSLGSRLNASMIEYLEWMAFTFAMGNLLFMFTLIDTEGDRAYNRTHQIIVWVTLVISLVSIVFPMERLNRTWFPIQDEVTENETYDQAKQHFTNDYDLQNPITHLQTVLDLAHTNEPNNYQIHESQRLLRSRPPKHFDD